MYQFLASTCLQYHKPGTVSNNPIYHLATVDFGIPKSLVIQTYSGANQFLCALDLVFMTPLANSATPAASNNTWPKANHGLLPQSL